MHPQNSENPVVSSEVRFFLQIELFCLALGPRNQYITTSILVVCIALHCIETRFASPP